MAWQYIIRTELIKNNDIKFRKDVKLKEDEIFVMEVMIYATSMIFYQNHIIIMLNIHQV